MSNLKKRGIFLNLLFFTAFNLLFWGLSGFNVVFAVCSFLLFFFNFVFEWKLILSFLTPIKKVLKTEAVDNLERREFFSADKIHKEIRLIIDEKNKNEEILNSLIEGVIVLDQSQMITYANEMAKKLFQEKKLKKIFFHELKKTTFLGKCLALVQKAKKAKALKRKFVLLDEALKTCFDVVAIPKQDQGLLLIFQDKTADYKIMQMGKEFVSNSSHELRTPITIIRGFAETLQDFPRLTPQMIKTITEKIINTSQRLENIISNLLMLADLDNLGKLRLSTCDLKEILEKQKSELLLLHQEAEIELRLPSEKEHVLVLADRGLLELAVRNLLENAVKYSNQKPVVQVLLEKIKNELYLSIKDQGIGIATEDLTHIFERFYTVDKARSRKSGGVGLGLSLVKNIIEKHRGKIEVTSMPNQGSTFTLRLPHSF